MMERFLERISLSEYKDKFILTGGMLVAAMVGLDARSTMDLDAAVKSTNVTVEDMENIISAIVSVPLEDSVSFRVKKISEIMDEAEYPGVRIGLETKFDGYSVPDSWKKPQCRNPARCSVCDSREARNRAVFAGCHRCI